MYQIYADGALVYDPNLDGYELLDLTATVDAEKAGAAEIVMPAVHPAYDAFTAYRTVVTIYRAGELLFRGRPLGTADRFDRTRTITCEGERCFLRDAVLEPYLYQAAPEVIFSDIIGRYNAQVDDFKAFRVGAITVTDPNGYVRLESESAEQVSDVIDKLVERVGGYITFSTDAAGRRVINWLAELTEENEQTVEFGENLLDLSRSVTNPDLATIIYPYGAKNETTGERVTIESVNGGRRYIQDDEAVALRGRIAKPVYYDDVTQADNLLRKARQDLAVSKLIITSLEVSVADLAAAGYDVDTLRVGRYTRVLSPAHGLDDVYLLRRRTYKPLNMAAETVVLGADLPTLTGSGVAGDRAALAQIRRSEQSLKTDYTISITDAVARVLNK